MKTLLKQWRIAVSLLAIFVAGQGIGYALCSMQKSKGMTTRTAADAPARKSIEGWEERSLEKLKKDLNLTDAQSAKVSAILKSTRDRIEFEKERASFQTYLQVYRAHAEMKPLLNPDQAARLEKMRLELEAQIKTQFTRILNGPDLLDLAL